MKITIQVPDPGGTLHSVHVEHDNRASRDLPSLHFRATLFKHVDHGRQWVRTLLELRESVHTDVVMRAEFPAFDPDLASRLLGALGFTGAGDWTEERLDDRGAVAWKQTAYTLRLQALASDEAGLLESAGWPLDLGVGGSMLLPMRLVALQGYGQGLRTGERNGLRAPEDQVFPPYTGRDYSGDRGPTPTTEVSTPYGSDESTADRLTREAREGLSARLRHLEDGRIILGRMAGDLGTDTVDVDKYAVERMPVESASPDEFDPATSRPAEHRDT